MFTSPNGLTSHVTRLVVLPCRLSEEASRERNPAAGVKILSHKTRRCLTQKAPAPLTDTGARLFALPGSPTLAADEVLFIGGRAMQPGGASISGTGSVSGTEPNSGGTAISVARSISGRGSISGGGACVHPSGAIGKVGRDTAGGRGMTSGDTAGGEGALGFCLRELGVLAATQNTEGAPPCLFTRDPDLLKDLRKAQGGGTGAGASPDHSRPVHTGTSVPGALPTAPVHTGGSALHTGASGPVHTAPPAGSQLRAPAAVRNPRAARELNASLSRFAKSKQFSACKMAFQLGEASGSVSPCMYKKASFTWGLFQAPTNVRSR